jgi:hypothetical protein
MAVTIKQKVRFGPYDADQRGRRRHRVASKSRHPIRYHQVPVDLYFPVHRTRSMV